MSTNGRNVAILGLGLILILLMVFILLMTTAQEQLQASAAQFTDASGYQQLLEAITYVRNLLWGVLIAGALLGLLTQILLARLIDSRNFLEQKVQLRTTELVSANDKLQESNQALERQSREIRGLNELGELLQAAHNLEEAGSILQKQLPRFFSSGGGAFYVIRSSRNLVEALAGWGEHAMDFVPEDCWALRRGKNYRTQPGDPRCQHAVAYPPEWQTLCIPLVAGVETQGVLCLADEAIEPAQEDFLTMLAEQLAINSANLRLAETLRHQSIRDPLTELFNRRYFDETLERELSRARRSGQVLSIVMVDLDHFKIFNDEHGHKAGDALLVRLSEILRNGVRSSDVPCRYGGEEFVVVLPDTPLEEARERAEQIRTRVAAMQVDFDNRRLPFVTASFGLAAFPTHGATGMEIIQAADRALYAAKEQGRNRVVVAEGVLPTPDKPSPGSV